MKGFRSRAEVADVQKLLLERIQPLPIERIRTVGAARRVLAKRITSPGDVPAFDRAAMDGYAVRAEDTFGASEYAPIELTLVGESRPGQPCGTTLLPGQAVRIMTGAPMPIGANAVLMAEEATCNDAILCVIGSVTPAKNVSKRGEDIRTGDFLLEAGRTLRPQDVGLLVAVGITTIPVLSQPSVDILATGNELLAPGETPSGVCIPDSNTPMLQALIARDGGAAMPHTTAEDDLESLHDAFRSCTGDAIVISGGSSVGAEDFVPQVVRELGELAVHGVAMRPSSPTGIGFIEGRPVFLLPGNPVSCLCAYDFFAGPSIRAMGGRSRDWPYVRVTLPLARKITSETGRVDYARVCIVSETVEPLMVSGAGILSSTTRADGFVIVERDLEGIPEGTLVTVYLYG